MKSTGNNGNVPGADWSTIKKGKKRNKAGGKENSKAAANGATAKADAPPRVTVDLAAAAKALDLLDAPDLERDDLDFATVIRTRLSEVLRANGPQKQDGQLFASKTAQMDHAAKEIIDKWPSVAEFMAEDSDILVVDDIIGLKEQKEQVMKMSLAMMEKKFTPAFASQVEALRNRRGSAVGSNNMPPVSRIPSSTPQQQQHEPFSLTPAQQSLSLNTSASGQSLSLPQGGSISRLGGATSPSSNITHNGLGGVVNVVPTNSSMTLPPRPAVESSEAQLQNQNLTAKLHQMSKQLRNAQIDLEKSQVAELDWKRQHDYKEAELASGREEIENLKGKLLENGNDAKEDEESTLIIRLKQELDGAKLKSRTLEKQLDIERKYSASVVAKYEQSLAQSQSSGGISDLNAPFSNSTGSFSRHNPIQSAGFDDSGYGLRHLLQNVSTPFGIGMAGMASAPSVPLGSQIGGGTGFRMGPTLPHLPPGSSIQTGSLLMGGGSPLAPTGSSVLPPSSSLLSTAASGQQRLPNTGLSLSTAEVLKIERDFEARYPGVSVTPEELVEALTFTQNQVPNLIHLPMSTVLLYIKNWVDAKRPSNGNSSSLFQAPSSNGSQQQHRPTPDAASS